jgi:glycosyltransferase involved in cell wall biosynthesis
MHRSCGSTLSADPRLVTIVIPVFNGARYVAEAIDSALAQTWPAVEVLVVDDGSNDGGATQRVVERFGAAVRFITKPNGGVGSALNAGIAAMTGHWFSWLSHDDLYEPTKVERAMQALEDLASPAIVFGEADFIDEHARFIGSAGLLNGLTNESDPRWLVLEGRLNGCTMLIPRACLGAVGPFDVGLPTTQDYALWFDLASRYPFVPVREALVRSRVHGEQGSRHERHLEEASLLFIRMTECMEQDDDAPSPQQTLWLLRRVQRILRRSPYNGARAYIDARVRRCLQEMEVALVCVVDRGGSPMDALRLLGESGARCSELLLIDRSEDASSWLRWTETAWPVPNHTVRMPGRTARAGHVLALALEHTHAAVLAVIDATASLNHHALQEGLQTIAAQETDIWMGAEPELPELGSLQGAVFRRASIAPTMVAGPQAFPMLGLHARLTVGQVPPVSADRPAGKQMPVLVQRKTAESPVLPLKVMPRSDRPTLLILVHEFGGGTIRYAELVAAAIGNRANVLFGWGVQEQKFRLSSCGPASPEIEYELPGQMDWLIEDLRALQVARVDAMHSIGMDQHFDRLLDALGVPYDLTFVDYHQVAHQPHLVDETGRFIGDEALRQHTHPLLRRTTNMRMVAAERVIACSRDLAGRIHRLTDEPGVLAVRIPEAGKPDSFALHTPPLGVREWLRVLFLGAIVPTKGFSLLNEVAKILRERQTPVRIECLGLIGMELPTEALGNPHLHLWGRYETGDLHAHICRLRPHLAWFPFMAPETHSFALSEALAHGLPVLTTGIGSIPERLWGRPATWLLTPKEATASRIAMWLDRLRRERLTTAPRWLPVDHLPPLREGFYPEEYLRPLIWAS